jgi:hypothetical protein
LLFNKKLLTLQPLIRIISDGEFNGKDIPSHFKCGGSAVADGAAANVQLWRFREPSGGDVG